MQYGNVRWLLIRVFESRCRWMGVLYWFRLSRDCLPMSLYSVPFLWKLRTPIQRFIDRMYKINQNKTATPTKIRFASCYMHKFAASPMGCKYIHTYITSRVHACMHACTQNTLNFLVWLFLLLFPDKEAVSTHHTAFCRLRKYSLMSFY